MELNRDIKKRDRIIFGKYEPSEYHGGCRHFDELDIERLEYLLDNHFIDPDECQNLSPTTKEFFSFMQKYPFWEAHGYVTSVDRSDYRITIEGIARENVPDDPEELRAYSKLCGDAEDFQANYCWYD